MNELAKLNPEHEIYVFQESENVDEYRGQISRMFRIQTAKEMEGELEQYAAGIDSATMWTNDLGIPIDPEIGNKVVLFGVTSQFVGDDDVIRYHFIGDDSHL